MDGHKKEDFKRRKKEKKKGGKPFTRREKVLIDYGKEKYSIKINK